MKVTKTPVLAAILFVAVVLCVGVSCKRKGHPPGHGAGLFVGDLMAHEPEPVPSTKPVEAKHVCMVNDNYMGVDQIPVLVEGKTYYGCCAGCVSKLQTNENNVRFAKDPLTGESVDKATAYTVAEGKRALYFKSESTYKKYVQQSDGIPMPVRVLKKP